MPLALVGRIKDAVVSVPRDADWRAGVERFLSTLTDDVERVASHLAVLEERFAGGLRWKEVFADATLPDGRPMPPSRRYAEQLVTEDRLPLYEEDSLRFSLDLHNPGNEAGVASYDDSTVDIAIVADIGYFAPAPGSIYTPTMGFEEQARLRAAQGATLGRLVARLFEATGATFAYADIGATGWVVPTAKRPDSVVHPAPDGVGPTDFLWSISVWSPDSLHDSLAERLQALTITDDMLAGIDRFFRSHYRIERNRLPGGALFLQYRWLFGSELRGERARIDTPLARQARLRSTRLLFRS